MINMRKYNFFLVITLILLSGCDDLYLIDTTAPTIEVSSPMAGGYLPAGEYALFEAKFVDDFELATYNIEIHENISGHAHGRIAATSDDPSLIKWSYKQSFFIPEGLTLFQAVLEDVIEIPSNTLAGPYHFIVQSIDKQGNATSFQDDSTVEMEVYITNDSQSVINITNLIEDELEIEVDILFIAEGDVSDPTIGEYAGMHSIHVVLGEGLHEGHDDNHGGRIAEEDLIDVYFEEQELQQFVVDNAIILDKVFDYIDFTLSQEQYDALIAEQIDHLLLTIKVFDEQGNITISNTDVHIG